MSAHNPKYNLTLNYAKIRNAQKKNKSSMDMEKEGIEEPQINSPDQIAKIQKEMETKLSNSFVNLNENKSMLYYNTTREKKNDNAINSIFDDNKFNRENLEYINTLLKAKEVEKEKSPHLPINQYNIKISSSNINMNNLSGSNHKKSASNSIDQPVEKKKPLNEKFNNSVDNPISKNWNPFAKKTITPKHEIIEDNLNNNSNNSNNNNNIQKIPENHEKEIENATKRDRVKSLFEQNNKRNNDFVEKKPTSNTIHQRDSSYSFRTYNKEEEEKNAQEPEFLNSLQNYLDYFNSNQQEKNEFSKPILSENRPKEIIELRNENQMLRQQLEKYEFKFKEISSTKKNRINEINSYKKRDEENQNIIKYQAQEINKLKNYISNLHFKLKYTQEALAREKIEAENSLIALKKVLYKKMKEADFENQINNLVQNHIPTKDKYSRSKEKTSRGHNHQFKDHEKNMMMNNKNYFQPETNESYFEMEKSMESSIKSSLSQEELFVEQFNTPYMKDKPHDYSNFSLHRKRKSANFNHEIMSKNSINKTQIKKKNISQMEENPWKEQLLKKDEIYLKKNLGKHKNYDNAEESFSMNEIPNVSSSIVNSD